LTGWPQTGRTTCMARKKMGDTRRKQILEGLLKAVAKRGLADCNMSDVAEAAKVSRGSLHYYFKNKHEMIGALVAYLRDTNLVAFHDQMDQINDPLQQLKESLWYPIKAFGKAGILLAKVWIEFWGYASHHQEVHSFIDSVQQSLRERYVEIITAGIESGVFSAEIQPERFASVILATLEGLILQWHFNPATFDFASKVEELEAVLVAYTKPR
jgi:TetR/AcrR family transcriptional regulator, fatty acid metabolism regulator protein